MNDNIFSVDNPNWIINELGPKIFGNELNETKEKSSN